MYRGEACYCSLMDYDRYRNIPNNLRRCRQNKGLTQIQVAQALGFKDKTWISHWENGDALPNLISLVRLSKLYLVPIEELFPDLVRMIGENEDISSAVPS